MNLINEGVGVLKDIFKIKIDLLSVPDFIRRASTVKGQVILNQNNSLVDGKSLIGVMSLNLESTINLTINSDDNCIECSKFREWMV